MWGFFTTAARYGYSYFKAWTGIMVAARRAGYKPEIIPMNVAKARANRGNQAGV